MNAIKSIERLVVRAMFGTSTARLTAADHRWFLATLALVGVALLAPATAPVLALVG